MKLTKKRYLIGFTVAVLVLAVIRVAFPQVAESSVKAAETEAVCYDLDSVAIEQKIPSLKTVKPHKILSVPSFNARMPRIVRTNWFTWVQILIIT